MSDNKTENYEFDVNTNQLMDIIIKSVYSSSDIFIRELVSNASDACDKLRSLYSEYADKGLQLDNVTALEIEIIPDLVNKTLTIKDNGIGMKKSDLINFIGTIASSGTRKFKEALEQKEGNADINNLIGQFGLGFYSSYLVAEKVDIVTRNPEDSAYLWSSTGKDNYTIQEYNGPEFKHGTSVILYMKEGNEEYLEAKKITALIKKHSQFVTHPVYIYEEKEVEDKGDEENKTEETNGQETDEPVVEEVKEEKEEKQIKKKKVVEKVKLNTEQPLWEKDIKKCTEEELTSFYKSISGDWDTYAAVKSWNIEGMLNIKLLLFIPKRSRMDMFSGKNKKAKNIKLYANNVFVTDDFGDNIPEWMNFVVGIVASNDIAMNVSRELIQGHNVMRLVKKTLPNKVYDMISNLSYDEEKYTAFYKEFGNCLKLAVSEADANQQEKYASLLRYSTTKSGDKTKSLVQYVDDMKENQKQIYVLTGLQRAQVENSPSLEVFKDVDLEVVLMHDPMDEVMLRGLKKFKDIPVQRITSEGVELPEINNEEKETLEKEFEAVATKVKEVLSNEVEKVIINTRLNLVPSVISTTKYSHSGAMEAIMKSQLVAETNPLAALTSTSKKIFELNPKHRIVQKLKEHLDNNALESFEDVTKTLYNTMLINCGFVLNDYSTYCKMVYKLLSQE